MLVSQTISMLLNCVIDSPVEDHHSVTEGLYLRRLFLSVLYMLFKDLLYIFGNAVVV